MADTHHAADEKKDHAHAKAKPKGTVVEREAKIKELQAEIVELQTPEPEEFPRWVHHADQPSQVVDSAEAEKKLGPGWSSTPIVPKKAEK